MIVPRAYKARSEAAAGALGEAHSEKKSPLFGPWPSRTSRQSRSKTPPLRQRSPFAVEPKVPLPAKSSAPVQIPQNTRQTRVSIGTLDGNRLIGKQSVDGSEGEKSIRKASVVSVKTVLSSTTIPPRKRLHGRKSQRLPAGDHVADFSRLMLDDVTSVGDGRSMTGSYNSPHLEELFGHSVDRAEDWKATSSAPAGSPHLSRCMSSESIPSLLLDDDTDRSFNELPSPPPLSQRGSSERRFRVVLSTSEDCAQEHPLKTEHGLNSLVSPETEPPNLETIPESQRTEKIRSFSFRSNLTASLRALRSAAQSVSNLSINPPLTRPDDFVTRSIFSFAPELTDDKRPPPSSDPPSPALRRYLNPQAVAPETFSPSDLNFYTEFPSPRPSNTSRKFRILSKRESSESDKTPTIRAMQLRTCIPSPHLSPHASSPPTWLGPDGTPITHPPAFSVSANPAVAKQREPRENAAFLRVLVAEMSMRRAGKFDEACQGHARVWLPARKAIEMDSMKRGRERWMEEGDDGGG